MSPNNSLIISKIVITIIAGIVLATPVQAETPTVEVVEEEPKLNIEQKIEHYATAYGVNEDVMYNVIKCESSLNPKAVGDGGQSRGLSQIHRPSHPHITDEQAFDEDFAIEFMAREMSQGNAWKWSCWKLAGRPSVV